MKKETKDITKELMERLNDTSDALFAAVYKNETTYIGVKGSHGELMSTLAYIIHDDPERPLLRNILIAAITFEELLFHGDVSEMAALIKQISEEVVKLKEKCVEEKRQLDEKDLDNLVKTIINEK